MTRSWTTFFVNARHHPAFLSTYKNNEPGEKLGAAFDLISAISYCPAPLHKSCFNLERGLLFECITICSQIAVQRLIVPQSPINILPGHNVHFYLSKISQISKRFLK